MERVERVERAGTRRGISGNAGTSEGAFRRHEERLRAGGLGYGDLKKALFEQYWEFFAEARAKRAELENNLDHVNQVLKDGAEKARKRATMVLDRARKNCGLA